MSNSNCNLLASEILKREVTLGEDQSCLVEMVLIYQEKTTWVLLRESHEMARAPEQPVLKSSFELICTMLRHELVHLRGLSDDLVFFHADYTMKPTGTVQWSVRPVRMVREGEHYLFATFHEPDAAQKILLNAALHSWTPPRRRLL